MGNLARNEPPQTLEIFSFRGVFKYCIRVNFLSLPHSSYILGQVSTSRELQKTKNFHPRRPLFQMRLGTIFETAHIVSGIFKVYSFQVPVEWISLSRFSNILLSDRKWDPLAEIKRKGAISMVFNLQADSTVHIRFNGLNTVQTIALHIPLDFG